MNHDAILPVQRLLLVSSLGLALVLTPACGGGGESPAPEAASSGTGGADAKGHVHEDGEADHPHDEGEADHAHDEAPLGTVRIGELEVTLAQGHGAVVAGGEGHLVVELPYSDGGSTVVRAWLGTQDRTLSLVGKGEYAPSHDDYDVHAMAPDPLPAETRWWIELERPDGTRLVGSATPLFE